MNILLINHYAGSPSYGMAYRPYYLSKEWVKLGHKVQLIAADFSHIRTRQPVLHDIKKMEIIDGIEYSWYPTPSYEGNGFARVKNIFYFLKKVWHDRKAISNNFQPDVVIASSTYPMDIWVARSIAKHANAKLIFEVHDLWPLSPIELGGMSRLHPFIMLCQLAEGFAYRNSDLVVSMLPNAKSYMHSRGMLNEKFVYIPNGVTVDEQDNTYSLPHSVKAALARVKNKNLPVIGYTGTYGLANALDFLLDAAKKGKGIYEVILVGTGPEEEKLLQRVKNEGIFNVTILPAIPKYSIPSFLATIDIAYIGWNKNPLYRFGISPNKLMDYMLAGKPILHSVEAGNDPVAEAGCGITVKPEDSFAIHKGLLDLIKMNPKKLESMGQLGKKYILSKQTYPVLAKKFLENLHKL